MKNRLGPRSCSVCHGGECHGGGVVTCLQRVRAPSILAGILDSYGGIRFVVTHRDRLKYHSRPDEVTIIVPDLEVHEPIAWQNIPCVIARIELEIDLWINQRGIPNTAVAHEAVTMYRLRQKEHPDSKRSLNFDQIAQT